MPKAIPFLLLVLGGGYPLLLRLPVYKTTFAQSNIYTLPQIEYSQVLNNATSATLRRGLGLKGFEGY
jgi:hypothetical protein